MIFVLIFAALGVSMATMSGTNVQIANNQRKVNGALSTAHSGLEITRLWLSCVLIPGTTVPGERFNQIANSFVSAAGGISNITPSFDGSSVIVPTVMLNSAQGQSFSARLSQVDADTLELDVTGECGTITRTIRVNYEFTTRAHTVFDFGVASKGPLSLAGNIELEGVNISVESSVYIESENSNLALSIIGNSQIAGDVSIANPLANVLLQGGQAGIGGETGQDAIDNHVSFGVPPTEFPAPDPAYFEHYVTDIVDSTTDTTLDAAYENIRIAAGTNPNFSGNVILRGIIFIETPNVVTFSGSSTITGIIIGDGDLADNSGANQINFTGPVSSCPVTELPCDAQFADIRNETGTFLMAPGFSASFGGNFGTLNGAIAANGINLYGNAGGTIRGSVINYSGETMELSGNSDLFFNRSGTALVPAGFAPEIVLQYDPASYSDVL